MTKKSKRKKIVCKECGTSWFPDEVPTNKEWTRVAPMPDSEGRVTVMMMATWSCPNCGKSKMGLKAKFKDDGTKFPSKKELLMDRINAVKDKISIAELSEELDLSEDNIEKALQVYIKRKTVSGKIADGYYIVE
jgi:transcription initiation factor TFIIIB Brf1 subunit/transcription initiation factor TFIIB